MKLLTNKLLTFFYKELSLKKFIYIAKTGFVENYVRKKRDKETDKKWSTPLVKCLDRFILD